MVQAYLEEQGYGVQTAADGLTALKAARAFRPDLVVLDIMLPGLDGIAESVSNPSIFLRSSSASTAWTNPAPALAVAAALA